MSFTRFQRFRSGAAATLLMVCAPLYADTADATAPHPKEIQKPVPAVATARGKIYEGMPAAELQSLIGKPDKVVRVETPPEKKGHAEVWFYKRLKRTSTDTITIGTRPIMGKRKQGDIYVDVVLSNEPVLKNRTTEIFEVASFLIVNGQYITSTKTEERQEFFL